MKSKKVISGNTERMSFQGSVEMRAQVKEEQPCMIGYALKFNQLSRNLGGWYERIMPGALDNTDMEDVRALYNHSVLHVLGRTKSETLRLSIDDIGLRYEIDLPNTTIGNDARESVLRGDIDQSSFSFPRLKYGDEYRWVMDQEDREIREVLSIPILYDVAPVTYAAYSSTEATMRSYQEFRGQHNSKNIDWKMEANRRRLQILSM